MTPLDMQAEVYTATGNIASEGMRNQLGRPRIDRLALLIRESAQNAWDAKAGDSQQVRFGIVGRDLSDSACCALREQVFRTTPPRNSVTTSEVQDLGQLVVHLDEIIDPRRTAQILFVYDRGTTGLGGPTRANQTGSGQVARDFVDFFRNVGTPPDTAQGGGTFGYGKAALYLASSAQTILVHTRTRVGSRLESRFMVSTLTNHYSAGDTLHTGRHWWGRTSPDGIVDPVVGREADEVAAALDFPPLGEDETGTTIGILAPDFSMWSQNGPEALEYAKWQIVHNFWPKMVPWPDEPQPRMVFESGWNGRVESVPDPTVVQPYSAFAAALTNVRTAEKEGSEEKRLFCRNPKKLLGRFDVVRCVEGTSPLARWSDWESVGNVAEHVHHIALLRRPELVVTYHAGHQQIPLRGVGYAGVFLADTELDRVYAGAEPPTHDAWNHEILNDRRAKTFVRTTYRRIKEELTDFLRPHAASPAAPRDGVNLTPIADKLGSVLVAVEGNGASKRAPEAGGGGKSGRSGGSRKARRGRVRLQPVSRLRSKGEQLVREFDFELRHGAGLNSTRVRAEPASALLGGGFEKDPPAGADDIRVLAWTSPSGHVRNANDLVDLDEEGQWILHVAVPEDASVSMKLSVVEGDT